MKNRFYRPAVSIFCKRLIYVLLVVVVSFSTLYSQTVTLSGLSYLNGSGSIPSGGTILVPCNEISVSYSLSISKPEATTGMVYIYVKNFYFGSETLIQTVSYVGTVTTFNSIGSFTVTQGNLQFRNGEVYAKFETSGGNFKSNVYPAISAICNNVIIGNQFIATTGDPVTLTSTPPTGGDGTFAYQWEVSYNGTTFSTIPGATGMYYDPPVVNQTTYYRRIVYSNGVPPSTSNILTVTVYKIITGSISGITFCKGTGVTVPYTITAPANAGNVFIAQLSDETGSFSSPINIGSTISTTSGSINAGILYNVAAGTGYLIRVIGTDPEAIGSAISIPITVLPVSNSTGTINPLIYCAGSNITVPFTTCGNYDNGNTFTAELSDATGSFSSPVVIGSVSGINSSSINAVLPSGLTDGTNYRIRVTSTLPATTGSDNGAGISILSIINTTFVTSICKNTSGFSIPFTACTSFNAGNIFTVELSDINGSFSTPVSIGTLSSTTSGNITISIPSTTPLGSGYKVRIVSSDPYRVSNSSSLDISNCGLTFDGVDDRVTINRFYYNGVSSTSMTIEAWVKLATTQPSANKPASTPIVSNRTGRTGFYTFGVIGNGTKLYYRKGSDQYFYSSAFTSINDNNCHHIAMVDDDNGLVTFYLDGTSVGSVSTFPGRDGTTFLFLGWDDYAQTSPKGNINEIRMWDIARTSTQIASNMSVAFPPNTLNLQGYWKFQEVSGQTIVNITNSNGNGVLGTSTSSEMYDPTRNSTSCFSNDKIGNFDMSEESNYMENLLEIFPNPAVDVVSINILDPDHQQWNIRIINSNGEVVFENSINQQTSIDIGKKLSEGIYLIQVFNETKVISKKFIKSN